MTRAAQLYSNYVCFKDNGGEAMHSNYVCLSAWTFSDVPGVALRCVRHSDGMPSTPAASMLCCALVSQHSRCEVVHMQPAGRAGRSEKVALYR